MCFLGVFTHSGLPSANHFCYFCNLAGLDEGRGKGLDVFGNAARVGDAFGHFSLEGAVTRKSYDVVEVVFGDA